MTNIDIISPDNNLTDQQKNGVNTLIDLIINNQLRLNQSTIKSAAVTLMTVSISHPNIDLLRWLFENNHCFGNDLICENHINMARIIGFDIELPNESS